MQCPNCKEMSVLPVIKDDTHEISHYKCTNCSYEFVSAGEQTEIAESPIPSGKILLENV